MTTSRIVAAAFALMAFAVVISAFIEANTPADASSTQRERPRAVFLLAVNDVQTTDPVPSGTATPEPGVRVHTGKWGASLTCSLNGGSHKQAGAACRQLREADGHIGNIPADTGEVCTDEYQPVQVVAEGRWNGESRSFEQVFPNRCTALAMTGKIVFDF